MANLDHNGDSNGIELRYVDQALAPVRIEERADEQLRIEGYAAVFYNSKPETEFTLWDGAVERVMPGAFDRTIKEEDVRALFNHDPNLILGRTSADTLKLEADSIGLKYTIVVPDTTAGRDVMANIRRGDVTGSSFSFRSPEVTWKYEGGVSIRELRSVRVHDLGPVVYPGYLTTTSAVRTGRAFDGLLSVRAEWDEMVESERRGYQRAARQKRDRARLVEIGLTTKPDDV